MGAALKTETLVVLGVALAAIYLAKSAAHAVADTVSDAGKAIMGAAADALPYINPADSKNVANRAATSLWQAATGSNGTLGTDFYDFMHKGDPIPGAVPDPVTGLTPAYNYTVEQQAADLKATRQLERGFHGM